MVSRPPAFHPVLLFSATDVDEKMILNHAAVVSQEFVYIGPRDNAGFD